jgi:hypothetical protein
MHRMRPPDGEAQSRVSKEGAKHVFPVDVVRRLARLARFFNLGLRELVLDPSKSETSHSVLRGLPKFRKPGEGCASKAASRHTVSKDKNLLFKETRSPSSSPSADLGRKYIMSRFIFGLTLPAALTAKLPT